MKCVIAIAIVQVTIAGAFADAFADGESNAEGDIRALLIKKCVGCHNESDKKGGLDLSDQPNAVSGGDSGAALNVSQPESSLLWARVAADEMPPNSHLLDNEKEILRRWLRDGGKWPGAKLNPFEFTSDTRAGYDWWSLQPLQNTAPPTSLESHPIDAYVAAKLAQNQMRMSPTASQAVLKRRIAYHLTGLPPSAIKDTDHSAISSSNSDHDSIEAWIDSLLDRPEFGQRWARHWLDAVRFGESHGFERDQLRTNSWRYRDWVVNAFNSDMSYQRFAKLQIAGDAIEPGAGTIATGMLVAGPYDQVGQTQQSKAMRDVVRQDELEDLVSVITQTFLGLTANCSRCHDHKFDPVTQREYYRLCASLAGTHHGDVKLDPEYLASNAKLLQSRIDERIISIREKIESIEVTARNEILSERAVTKVSSLPPKPFASWEFDDLKDSSGGGLDLELRSSAALRNGQLAVGGTGYAISKKLKQDLKEKTLEVWVQLNTLGQGGGAAISIETADGAQFDGIVFGERETTRWVVGSNQWERSESFRADEAESSQNELVHIAMVFERDGTIRAYRNGKPYGSAIRKSKLLAFPAKTSHVLFGLRHSPFAESKVLQAVIERAQLYDRALSESEVVATAQSQRLMVTAAQIASKLGPQEKLEVDRLRFERNQLEEQRNRVNDPRVYAVASKLPTKTHVLARGSTFSPLGEVMPGGIAALCGIEAEFRLEPGATDLDRRQALADWIANERNPLFARVIVNRVWKQYFGVGMVATPNDFGFNGARPSHPELLDWLAKDLIDHDWSLKHLHRRILTSKTYQQSSQIVPEFRNKDADNRLLWRHSPSRVDAESLRDTILALAGKLDRSLDGPGFYDFEMTIQNSHFYFMRDPLGESFQRRTLYRTLVRSARSNLLDVFDCPDPSTKTPQRTDTTTPLQSLALMNNSFVVRMSEAWAEKVVQAGIQAGEVSAETRLKRLFDEAYGRTPSDDEFVACKIVLDKHGLSTVCRALLNSNELLYVD